MAKEAEHRPAECYAFQQYHLNIWHGNSRDPLFSMDTYDQGIDPHFDIADLESLPCHLGVDMSLNGDLTAVIAAWRHDDGCVSIHPWFFVPDEDLQ
ncbi:terminase TerL endonuclease subunit, partial [Streptococcus suis]